MKNQKRFATFLKTFFLFSLFGQFIFPANAQSPEPEPKSTLLDINNIRNTFDNHLRKIHSSKAQHAFATGMGIPIKEVKKRGIRKISFKDIGNDLEDVPPEIGDYGRHYRHNIRKKPKPRIDTLPPEPTQGFSYSYEYNRKGQLTLGSLEKDKSEEKEFLHRSYYPDGKLKESMMENYKPVDNFRDTLFRDYSGYKLQYDKAGRISSKISYGTYTRSSFQYNEEKRGYDLVIQKRLTKTNYKYNSKGKLLELRSYLLPDSGQAGSSVFQSAAFYFYDKKGNPIKIVAVNSYSPEKGNYSADAMVGVTHYAYKGNKLFRRIKEKFDFNSALPDTVKLAQGEVAVDSATLGQPDYDLPEDGTEYIVLPYLSPAEDKPDTVYFLQPNETRDNFRNYYLRLDKKGRVDLAYGLGYNAERRLYNKRVLENRTDNGRHGYECRFIWLNRKEQPEREIWVNRYSSDTDIQYWPGDGYPDEEYETLEDLITHKRITVVDQKYFYREDGLPEKVKMRGSYNRETLRKVGEAEPNPELTEALLRPCHPCEPCEKVMQVIKERPEWPYRASAAKVFTDFEYEFYD